jgi:hypothetical protein
VSVVSLIASFFLTNNSAPASVATGREYLKPISACQGARFIASNQTGKAAAFQGYAFGQFASFHNRVDQSIAPDSTAQLGAIEQINKRRRGRQGAHLGAAVCAAIRRRQKNTGIFLAQMGAYFLKATHQFSGALGQTDQIQAAPAQHRFRLIGQIGRCTDFMARRPRERALGARGAYHIALGAHPQTPARQFPLDIGDHSIVRIDDEPD